MPIVGFPNPENTSPEGLLAVGGDLHPQSLLLAYRQGIFPWPIHDSDNPLSPPVLAWFCPPQRAILQFNELHLSRRLLREIKNSELQFTIDAAFEQVIEACSLVPRPGQSGTWITDDIKKAYVKLFDMGYAHSFEAWNNDQLVGGLYGVAIDGVFSGESMFHRQSNASKLVIIFLSKYLEQKGLKWMDIQTITPHMKALGAKTLERSTFLSLLKATQNQNHSLF